MVRPGMLRGRGVRAVAVLAIGAATVIAVAVVMSGRPAPGGHAFSPAGQSGASPVPAGPAAVSLVASHVSPAVTPVAMALHGTLAAGTGSASLKYGGTYLWDTATGKVIAIVRDPAGGIGPIAFSADGTTLAEVGAGIIYLWDIAARKFTATLPIPRGLDVTTLAFSPNGKALAEVAGGRLSTIYLWDIAAGKVTATLANPGPYGVSCVAFAPGGTTVALGEDTGAILLWDTLTGKVAAGPSGPRSDTGLWAGAIAFGPGGTLAAGGYFNGGTTYLWDDTGTLIAAVTEPARHNGGSTAPGEVLALWFSPGGTTLTIGDGSGATYLWRITR